MKYPSLSACFRPVDGKEFYLLKELVPTGLSIDDNDMIQLLNTATTVSTKLFQYIDEETAKAIASDMDDEEPEAAPHDWKDYKGWWDATDVLGTSADNEQIPVGTAFLGNISSGNSVSFLSSGEAPTASTSFTTDGNKYPFFGNYLPKQIPLKKIVPVGLDIDSNDMIQFLNPATTVSTKLFQYIGEEVAQGIAADLDDEEPEEAPHNYLDYMGWWDATDVLGTSCDDEPIYAGTAFLGNISSGNKIEFQFPSVLAD